MCRACLIKLVLWPGWWENLKKMSLACILNGLFVLACIQASLFEYSRSLVHSWMRLSGYPLCRKD